MKKENIFNKYMPLEFSIINIEFTNLICASPEGPLNPKTIFTQPTEGTNDEQESTVGDD